MKWQHPPIIKIYEALGALADGRVEILGNAAKVYSSSGNKFYDVSYDPNSKAIMANDNGSYWKGYLGYPAIAFLLKIGELPYKAEFGELLKGIKWKDINQQFQNNFDKTLQYIESSLSEKDRKNLADYVILLDKKISESEYSLLGTKTIPPKGY